MMPASREARQVQRLSISTGPLMTKPGRYDDVPSRTTPLSRGGVQFEEITLAPASKERAFLTASQPADFMKKASDNSVKLIRLIVSDTAGAWQLRSPANTRDTPRGGHRHANHKISAATRTAPSSQPVRGNILH